MSTITPAPPARVPEGVTDSPRGYLFGHFPFPAPMRLNQYFNDFNTYAAGDWTVTSTSTGTSALTDGNGGLIVLTTAASLNDAQSMNLKNKAWYFTTGAQWWYAVNVKLSDATNSLFIAGFADAFTTVGPTGPTNGVYFSKADGTTTLSAIIRGNSTSTTMTVGTMANNTTYTLGFYYNGKPTPTLYFYSTIPYTTGSATGPTAFGQPYFPGGNAIAVAASSETGATNTLANLPVGATGMYLGFGVKSGATGGTAARTATIDYVLGAEEIARY
jgi:hypothetical protein